MKIIIQRVSEASVKVNSQTVGQIEKGLLLLIGIGQNDNEKTIDWCVNKVINMRIFSDEQGKMNLSLKDINGSILAVSQFTLYASIAKGNRPSFTESAPPKEAEKLYQKIVEKLRAERINVSTGIFGANMQVSILNDGPVTIIVER